MSRRRLGEGGLTVYLLKPVPTEPDKIRNFIDGQFVEPVGGRYLDNIEPATGKPYSQVADSDSRDVDLAVSAAEKAFVEWSRTPAAERSRMLLRIADLIERDLEKLARAESIDTGKPLSLARSARYSARRCQLPLLRHRDPAHRVRSAHHRWRRVQLHAASAARHRWIDFAVEPPALPAQLENRAGDRVRQHRHCQTERADTDDGVPVVRNLSRSGFAQRRPQRRARHRAKCRRRDHGASEDRHDLIHRRHGDRPQGGGDVRAVVQESVARAGREESEHRLCRRRPGRRHRRQPAFFIREPGPDLPVRFARVCRAIGVSGFRRSLCRKSVAVATRRSARREDRPGRDREQDAAR